MTLEDARSSEVLRTPRTATTHTALGDEELTAAAARELAWSPRGAPVDAPAPGWSASSTPTDPGPGATSRGAATAPGTLVSRVELAAPGTSRRPGRGRRSRSRPVRRGITARGGRRSRSSAGNDRVADPRNWARAAGAVDVVVATDPAASSALARLRDHGTLVPPASGRSGWASTSPRRPPRGGVPSSERLLCSPRSRGGTTDPSPSRPRRSVGGAATGSRGVEVTDGAGRGSPAAREHAAPRHIQRLVLSRPRPKTALAPGLRARGAPAGRIRCHERYRAARATTAGRGPPSRAAGVATKAASETDRSPGEHRVHRLERRVRQRVRGRSMTFPHGPDRERHQVRRS